MLLLKGGVPLLFHAVRGFSLGERHPVVRRDILHGPWGHSSVDSYRIAGVPSVQCRHVLPCIFAHVYNQHDFRLGAASAEAVAAPIAGTA